jgi:hypothetical protein
MKPADTLRFASNTHLGNAEIRPSRLTPALLAGFQKDESEFLRGSSKEVDQEDRFSLPCIV